MTAEATPAIEPIHPELDFVIHRLESNDRWVKTRTSGLHGFTVGDEVKIYLALKRTLERVKELEAAAVATDSPAPVQGKRKP